MVRDRREMFYLRTHTHARARTHTFAPEPHNGCGGIYCQRKTANLIGSRARPSGRTPTHTHTYIHRPTHRYTCISATTPPQRGTISEREKIHGASLTISARERHGASGDLFSTCARVYASIYGADGWLMAVAVIAGRRRVDFGEKLLAIVPAPSEFCGWPDRERCVACFVHWKFHLNFTHKVSTIKCFCI